MTLSILATACAIAVVAGPFGTYDTMMWPTRLAYWGLVIGLGILIGGVVRAIKKTVCYSSHPAMFDIGAGVMTSVALAPVIWFLRGNLDPMMSHADLSIVSIGFNTLLIVIGIFVLRRQIGAEQPASYARRARVSDVPVTRLHRRMSDWPNAEIMRLSANDHFVDVATPYGVETLRLRLSDAIAEMEPVEGVCTHRSHWVALRAIDRIERDSGKIHVVLRNGDRVPVSRKYRVRLEDAGLLERQDGAGQGG
ncbi:MAG: LytTR family DNA-binding domain-containing protein [Roseovarius sp.]|uniref:LytTR family DNA-binding domain-containing protein n=1 Tax=Roseovarius sp. TaxID=1486281 RepID=UPI0032ED02C9